MSNDFDIVAKELGASTIVALSGRIDYTGAPRLHREVLRNSKSPGSTEVVLDFGKVTWLDSMAMGTLLTIRQHLERDGKKLVFANCHGSLLDGFKLLKFNKIFEIR
jgi:anti-anti-sigma factor